MLLEGRTALVSGAGPGLGRSICRRLAAEGARLVVGDLDPEAVEQTLAEVRSAGGEAVGQVTDITDEQMCRSLVELAVRTYGGLQILVNDAYHGGDYQRFADADLAGWRHTTDVNVWGTLRLTQAALPELRAAGDGRVVMICTHGVDLIQPQFGAYTGSKAALAHFTQLLAAELGGDGIRVNAVFPGPMLTPGLRQFLGGEAERLGITDEEMAAGFADKNSLKYLIPPDEVAGSVVFLASDLARPVTGQAIYANAGETFH
jgi:NAD(P)-dependent dehydrogenase (short-subunit alcohol dehydrogenase family)